MAETALDETLALLTRLSQKPGVQSTLILSRQSGAIVRSSGLISGKIPANNKDNGSSAVHNITDGFTNGPIERGSRREEDVARLVLSFVEAAGLMVESLDQEDDIRLLRLRTKKNEFVIVPHAKYLLVVIHDTPPA